MLIYFKYIVILIIILYIFQLLIVGCMNKIDKLFNDSPHQKLKLYLFKNV